MNSGDAQDRNQKAAEYLQLLRVLSTEMEIAMHAIARNALSELEESVANQNALSSRLATLVNEICVPLETGAATTQTRLDESMMRQIRTAAGSLEKLNRRYAALLQHSSRCVAQMAALFNSARGQIKEDSGPRIKYQTWSCQM